VHRADSMGSVGRSVMYGRHKYSRHVCSEKFFPVLSFLFFPNDVALESFELPLSKVPKVPHGGVLGVGGERKERRGK